ncbi:hypothetical protein ACHAWF_003854 [Thalassiosira exigua]
MHSSPLGVVLVIVLSCRRVFGSDAIRGRLERGPYDVPLVSKNPDRRLEDYADADDNATAAGAYDYYDYYDDDAVDNDDGWYQIDQGGNETNSSAGDDIVSKMYRYRDNAESEWWTYYEKPPSEWTAHQWDLAFGLLFGFVFVCCTASACCAYCFVNMHDTDEKSTPAWSPRSPQTAIAPRPKTRRNNRNRYLTEEYYKQYQGENEDDADVTAANMDVEEEQQSSYEPPARTSSLADYLSMQREKEARIAAALKWQEEQQNLKTDADAPVKNVILDPTNKNLVNNNTTQRVVPGDWGGYVNSHTQQPKRKKSAEELDAAMSKQKGKVEEVDKLIEARDVHHNQVGYYM